MQVVNLIFLLGSRASQLRKVLAPRSPALHPRARLPAHPPTRPRQPLVRARLVSSCLRPFMDPCPIVVNELMPSTAIQEALLPYFDSPADLLAADKAMHQGDLAKYGEMVTPGTRLAPAVQTDANAPPHVAVWLGRTGGDRAPPSQLDRAHANYTSACSQAQRLR